MDFNVNVNVFHHWCMPAPSRPAKPSLAPNSKRQLSMATFGFKVILPAPGASDVATRELSITVNGGDPPQVTTLPGVTLLTDELVFNADDKLVMTLTDIDAKGNRSPASAAFSYDVIDDVAPPAPGELGVQDKRQID